MGTLMRRAERNARNRTALLNAARSVFLRAGYHATTVDAIAREAGFTTGAIYSRFEGKADLFLALLEERIDERARVFGELPRSGDDGPIEAARKWAEIMRTELDWSLLVIEFRVHAARDDELNARYAALHERAVRSLVANIAASRPADALPSSERLTLLARAALASSAGAALARAVEKDDFSDELYEEIAIALSSRFTEEASS